MKIHFLNVGKGNCSIIEFPSGHLTIIDIDNSRNSDENDLTDPIEYLKKNFKGKDIFRFILTHPDMDHMSGLNELHKNFSIINFWDTDHDKELSEDDLDESPYEAEDWKKYQKLRVSKENPKTLQILRHESRDFWNKDYITVLSPASDLLKLSKNTAESSSDKYNHLSYVFRVDYCGIRILFGGDATMDTWDSILKNCGKESLKADIFLAPHHGSKNSFNEDVFKHIAPDWVVVSVVKGNEYDYNSYNKLAKKRVLSTKHYGNIRVKIEPDGKYQFYVDKNAN
jgi:beta-lactamase superfamily II metal-dependent hydrolase